MGKFFDTWLSDALGLETKQRTIKIDRAHRALSPPKKNYNRLVVVKPHNFIDKQQIFATAIEKGKLIYQGSKIHTTYPAR